ncbi:MAG: CBS domain-containing protein [Candidatus Bathyarchaeota archaeon]|nr:MAG: CBS domain-containing protein [Candidatus Bathyarchaeota archaeon]
MPAKIVDVMTRDVKKADSEETILEATKIMNRFDIGSMVVTQDGQPVGIVTERDILKRLVSKGKDAADTKLHEIMSQPLVTAKPHMTVTAAARLMIQQKVKKLIVTNGDRLVGMASITDLIPLLREEGTEKKLPLKNASKGVKKVFDIYFDPKRQIRKRCPIIILGGSLINCLGPKCMWYTSNGCTGYRS